MAQIMHDPGVRQNFKEKKVKISLGSVNVNTLLFSIILPTILVPFYTNYEAVSQQQEKPFPQTTITNTACHYPQAILFRGITLTGAVSLHLFHLIMNKYFRHLKRKSNYQGSAKNWLFWTAQISNFGYIIAIATIDTEGYPSLHTYSAIIFFVVWYIIMINNTILSKNLRNWDSSLISSKSCLIKSFLTIYMTVIFLYCLLMSKLTDGDFKYIVILEWNLYISFYLWLLSFSLDWKQIKLGFFRKKSKEQNAFCMYMHLQS